MDKIIGLSPLGITNINKYIYDSATKIVLYFFILHLYTIITRSESYYGSRLIGVDIFGFAILSVYLFYWFFNA